LRRIRRGDITKKRLISKRDTTRGTKSREGRKRRKKSPGRRNHVFSDSSIAGEKLPGKRDEGASRGENRRKERRLRTQKTTFASNKGKTPKSISQNPEGKGKRWERKSPYTTLYNKESFPGGRGYKGRVDSSPPKPRRKKKREKESLGKRSLIFPWRMMR